MVMRIDYIGLGARIKETRLARGYSQRKLAELIGKSDSYVQQIENGRRHPTLDALNDLCYALDSSPNSLLVDSLPENRFGEVPYLSAVTLPRSSPSLCNTLTDLVNPTAADEAQASPTPAQDKPIDLQELPPLGFLSLADPMPDPIF